MKLDLIISEEKKRVINNGIFSMPNHYVIDIPTEEEQDCFLYELSSLMYSNKLRLFHGLDRWLYFNLNGSQSQIDTIKGIITSSSVYDNYFEGLLAFDASELLLPTNKKSRDSFIRMISSSEYSHHATIVVFLKEINGVLTKEFLDELSEHIDYRIVEYSKIR